MRHMLIPTNNTQLHAEVHAQNGPPTLLLHFSDGNASMWSGVVPFLADRRWVINLDLRGHGQSARPEAGYSISTMADDVLGVLDALGVSRADGIGSSMGAEVALRLAAEHPERVRTLVLEQAFQNTFGTHGIHDVPAAAVPEHLDRLCARLAARPPVTGRSPAEALYALLEGWELPGEEPYAGAMRGSIGPVGDGLYGLVWPRAGREAFMRDYWLTRFEQDFARVRCPVLFLPDEASMQRPQVQASMAWFRSLLSESYEAVIPGGSHAFMSIDRPAEVAQAVWSFYKGVEQRWRS